MSTPWELALSEDRAEAGAEAPHLFDSVFTRLLLEFGFTAVTAVALLVCAWATWTGRASSETLARFARRSALALAVFALVTSAFEWSLRRDWMHFHWSMAYPMLALHFVSGGFLASMWPDAASSEFADRHGGRELSRSRWWFPAVIALLALTSIVMLLVFPGRVPPHRNTPGPLLGVVQIAAYGLGLGELPPVLAVVHPEEAARGMGSLTRDLTVPFSVLTLAARGIVGYVALGFLLRVVPNTRMRGTLGLVAPMLATAATYSLWQEPAYGYWQFEPVDIHAFGPTLAAAALALVALAVR
jgi:hypothetical protein